MGEYGLLEALGQASDDLVRQVFGEWLRGVTREAVLSAMAEEVSRR